VRKLAEFVMLIVGSTIVALVVCLFVAGVSSSGVNILELTHAFFWACFVLGVAGALIGATLLHFSMWRIVLSGAVTAIMLGGALYWTNAYLTKKRAELDASNRPPPPLSTSVPGLPPQMRIIKNPPVPQIKIIQHGNGNGAVGGSVNVNGDCNVINNGGSNNRASPNCTPEPRPPMFNFNAVDSSIEDSAFSGVGVNIGVPGYPASRIIWRHNVVDETPWFRHLEQIKGLAAYDAVNPRFIGTVGKIYAVLPSESELDFFVYVGLENKGQPSVVQDWKATIGSKTVQALPVKQDVPIVQGNGTIWATVSTKDSTPEIVSNKQLGHLGSAHGWIRVHISDDELVNQLRKPMKLVLTCRDKRGSDYVVARGDVQRPTETTTPP
jgi:hypothetical protein